MKKFSNKLYKLVSKKIVIISIVLFIAFISTVAPLASSYMDKITEGAPSPDTSFDYEAEDLFDMAKDYGEEGRRAYVTLRFTFDLAFPLIYLFFLVATSTKLLSYLPKKSRFRCFNLLPFYAVIFDFMENILTAIVIGQYPNKMIVAAEIAPYATMIKWVFVGLSFALIIVFGMYRLYFITKNKFAS